MFCKECGTEYDRGQRFCSNCGADLEAQMGGVPEPQQAAAPQGQPPHTEPTPVPAPAPAQEPQKTNSPLSIMVSLVSVAVICVCALVLAPRMGGCSGSGPVTSAASKQISVVSASHALLDFKETRVVAVGAEQAKEVIQGVSSQLGLSDGVALGEVTTRETDGGTVYAVLQEYEGVPIFGREAMMSVDDDAKVLAIASSLEDFAGTPETEPSVSEDDAQATLSDADPSTAYSVFGLYLIPVGDSNYELAYVFKTDDGTLHAVSALDGRELGIVGGVDNGLTSLQDQDAQKLQALIDELTGAGLAGKALSEDEAQALVNRALAALPSDGDYDLLCGLIGLMANDLDADLAERVTAALSDTGAEPVSVTKADESLLEQEDELTSAAFAQFPRTFVFTSGAGGWGTVMDIAPDGTFTGNYHDSDMGDRGDSYPNGTRHECDFEGKFSAVRDIDGMSYELVLESLTITSAADESIQDGVRVIGVEEVYGLGSPTSTQRGGYTLLLPGYPASNLSSSARNWIWGLSESDFIDGYALLNTNDGELLWFSSN